MQGEESGLCGNIEDDGGCCTETMPNREKKGKSETTEVLVLVAQEVVGRLVRRERQSGRERNLVLEVRRAYMVVDGAMLSLVPAHVLRNC